MKNPQRHPLVSLDSTVTLDKARCALAQSAVRFVVGPHAADCDCGGTGWAAVEDPVLGDLIDARCPYGGQ
jgi:hypothetical protein